MQLYRNIAVWIQASCLKCGYRIDYLLSGLKRSVDIWGLGSSSLEWLWQESGPYSADPIKDKVQRLASQYSVRGKKKYP